MGTKKRTISQGVRAYLRDGITSGRYKANMYLPAERVLADELGVSKTMIHTNLEYLQEEGLIQLHHGRGALVCKVDVDHRVLNRFFLRISDFGNYAYLGNVTRLLEGVCRGAEKKGTEILMSFSDSSRITDEIIMQHNHKQIQGVIYLLCDNIELLRALQKAKIPHIIASNEKLLDSPCLRIDYKETVRRAVRYLVRYGHRRIGLINGNDNNPFYREFAIGFRGVMAEEELEYRKDWLFKIDSPKSKIADTKKLIEFLYQEDLPSAFFCVRDYRAECFYKACESLKYCIPKDFSVISFDNGTWPDAVPNNLTTFQEPCHELGEGAVDMLADWIRTGVQPEDRILNCDLIERGSVTKI